MNGQQVTGVAFLVTAVGLAVLELSRARAGEPPPSGGPDIRLESVSWTVLPTLFLEVTFDLVSYEDEPVPIEIGMDVIAEPSKQSTGTTGPIAYTMAAGERVSMASLQWYVGGYAQVSAEVWVSYMPDGAVVPVVLALAGSGVMNVL
jgi:hypothetical protein